MNADFPRILTLLRKEAGISQKQAAQELLVSQALLSHYEKGIRECGLSFVSKAADFYDVSCDFLLGRSPERKGTTLTIDQLPQGIDQKDLPNNKTLTAIYNKKLIISSINILYDLLIKSSNKGLMNEVSSFLTMAIYRMFRIMFRASKKNNQEMFVAPKELANALAQASMVTSEATASAIVDGALHREFEPIVEPDSMMVSMEILDKNYPNDKSALLNLIKNCESKIVDIK